MCQSTENNFLVHILHLAIKATLVWVHVLPSHLDNVQIHAERSSLCLMYFVSKFQKKAYGLMQVPQDLNAAMITLHDIMFKLSKTSQE